jgi:hypothetical protein
MSKPTYTAYVVTNPRDGTPGKAQWREVSALWPHSTGKGFDLVIYPQLSISGRIVCTARKARDNGGLGDER